MSNYLLAAKVLESSGRHPEALASIRDATPACATFSLPLTVTILLPPRRGVDLRWFGWRCTEGASLPSRLRLETSKDGTDYEEHQSVEVSARRELHCVRPIGPRVNFLRVDFDVERKMRQRCEVNGAPTFALYRGTERVGTHAGADEQLLRLMLANLGGRHSSPVPQQQRWHQHTQHHN